MRSSKSNIGSRTTAQHRQIIAGYQDQIVSLLWTKPVQLSLHIAKVSL